jgi:hypothetical protein
MAQGVEVYLEKRKAAVDAENEVNSDLTRLTTAISKISGLTHDAWKRIAVPGIPPQVSDALQATKSGGFPEWPSPDEVKDKIAKYHVAVVECQQAFRHVAESQKTSLLPPLQIS